MRIRGIDVSSFQGEIHWEEVKRDHIEFAILRAGYGRFPNQIDRRFEENYREAKRHKIPVGAYLYSYATTVEEARQEARNLQGWLRGKRFEFPIYYDLEDQSQAFLSKRRLTDIAIAFCDEMERAGYFVGVYANAYWLTTKLDHDRLTPYTIWLADYAPEPSYRGEYKMWQYTSRGKVAGIHGDCDMDYCYQDFPKIIKRAGLNGFERSDEPHPGHKPHIAVYTVQKGDTLIRIAERYHTTWQRIARENRIADPRFIYPGQKLKIYVE